MKRIVALVFALMLAASLSFAAEKKDPPKSPVPSTIQKSAKAELL